MGTVVITSALAWDMNQRGTVEVLVSGDQRLIVKFSVREYCRNIRNNWN